MALFVSYILACHWKNEKTLEITSRVSAHTRAPRAGCLVMCGYSDPLLQRVKKQREYERHTERVLEWRQGMLNLISAFFFQMHKGLPIYLLTKFVQIWSILDNYEYSKY